MSEIGPQERNSAFQQVFEFLMNHSSQVDVAEKYPLEEFEKAIKAYEKAGRNGKILLIS